MISTRFIKTWKATPRVSEFCFIFELRGSGKPVSIFRTAGQSDRCCELQSAAVRMAQRSKANRAVVESHSKRTERHVYIN